MGVVLGLAAGLVPCVARADEAEDRQAVFVVAEGRCPAPAAVIRELLLMQGTLHRHLVLDHPEENAIALLVIDLTDRYQVSIDGRRTTTTVLKDPDRRCDKRAIIAAQTLLLALEPPLPEPPPPAQPVVPVPPARRRAPESHVDLEAAGVLEGAPNDLGSISGGASLRLVVGARHLAGSLGLKFVSPTPVPLSSEPVNLFRIPIDVSLRGRLRWGIVEGQGEIGALFFIGVPVPGEPGFTAGLRAALMLHVWITKWIASFVGLQSDVMPVPMHIEGKPNRTLTTDAPLFWIGGTAGVAVRLK